MFGKIYDPFLTLVYPQECHVCRNSVEEARNGVACDKCWSKTRIFSGNETFCHKCGKFHNQRSAGTETFCNECADQSFDLARAAGLYESALSASILKLKKEPWISGRTRDVVLKGFGAASFEPPVKIIPIPLSKRRYIERGFNQALIIAALLSKETGIPIDEKVIARKKHAKVHRAEMDRRGRELSVMRSFVFAGRRKLDDENVLLVDDVFASGATASACAKILKQNGAATVNVFTMARAN